MGLVKLTESFSWEGRRIAWARAGSGPPVVFCHGTPFSSRVWAPYAEALADRFTVEWSRLHEALLAPLRVAIADSGGDPERDAPAIYHLAIGTMQAALVRRTRPSQADVDHVVECSVAIVERTQSMVPGRRSDMDTEHGR